MSEVVWGKEWYSCAVTPPSPQQKTTSRRARDSEPGWTLVLLDMLNGVFPFFRHLKLELLTQFPASNDEKCGYFSWIDIQRTRDIFLLITLITKPPQALGNKRCKMMLWCIVRAYRLSIYPLGIRRCCDVASTSMTLIQRCNNVVCPVGTTEYFVNCSVSLFHVKLAWKSVFYYLIQLFIRLYIHKYIQ